MKKWALLEQYSPLTLIEHFPPGMCDAVVGCNQNYIYIYNIIYICIDIYNIIYSIYISLNGLASFFSLPRYWLTIMRNWRHSSISTFCASGVATDQICSFNGHGETIPFCFVTHICCSLAYDIKISLVPQDQYSLNINTTSSLLLDSTYYKRAIIGQTYTILNKTSLFPVTSLWCLLLFFKCVLFCL